MNVDIVKLVRDSMEKIGCSSLVAEHLDAHSPICLRFNSVPDMCIECEDERIRVWSKLDYRGDHQLSGTAADLLGYLMPRSSPCFVTQRPLLSLVSDELLLQGQLEPTCTYDADVFAQALETFYEDLCAVNEILAR